MLALETDLKLVKSDFCFGCGKQIPGGLTGEADFYSFPYVYTHRGKTKVSLHPACSICSMVDAAICEANDEGRRYTEISVGIEGVGGEQQYGLRCLCGAVKLVSLYGCIQCARRFRMLGIAEAEAKIVSNLLKQLRKRIREKKCESED